MIRNALISLLASSALAGCATSGDLSKPVVLVKGPLVQTISGPYDAAKHCIAQIPEVKSIRVAVGEITDKTGKVNVAEGGTGSFVSQGATDMFHSTLAEIGVQLVEMSRDYRTTIDWLASKNVKGGIKQPQFIVLGSIPALDFLPGSVAELSIYGVGPKSRAYQAVGRMDVRMTTLPYNRTAGGVVVATSSVEKQFTAIENEFGVASFVGFGADLTYASFRIGAGQREPMQYALGYMADYAAVDMIGQLIEQLSTEGSIKNRKTQVTACRKLLNNPYRTGTETQVASAT